MKNKIINNIKAIVFGIILAAGASYAVAWSGPLHTPPQCISGETGCDAPIHVGNASQDKKGALRINTSLSSPATFGLDVWGISRFYGDLQIGNASSHATIQINDGNQASGKVLVSDANGKASWKAISTTGGSVTGGTCSVGKVIQSIDSNGAATCGVLPGTVLGGYTKYSGGTGVGLCQAAWGIGNGTNCSCPSTAQDLDVGTEIHLCLSK